MMQQALECLIAGVDEAGRGPLAGPVVAAAVILNPDDMPAGLADSKLLSAPRREDLAREIRARARGFAIGMAASKEIDRVNILNATMLAMRRAVRALPVTPGRVLVDGDRSPVFRHRGRRCIAECVVGGDALLAPISAASIIAKVHRDEVMIAIDRKFPHYGFARHKGYATREHFACLERHGPCPEHRRSFQPVKVLAG